MTLALAGLSLGDADYAWVTRELCYVANKHAHGRIVSTLDRSASWEAGWSSSMATMVGTRFSAVGRHCSIAAK